MSFSTTVAEIFTPLCYANLADVNDMGPQTTSAAASVYR